MAQTGYLGGHGGFSRRGGYSSRFSLLSEGPNGEDDEWLINDGKRRRRSTGGRYKEDYSDSPVIFGPKVTTSEFKAMSGDKTCHTF